MTELEWNAFDQRIYEVGIDRGVLYVPGSPGVAWNGLISFTESPKGGEASSFYADGIKYLNLTGQEEFEGSLSAYSSPIEFDACEGRARIAGGLIITGQSRKSFGFSYRTRVGNDTFGVDYGYKIHIIYNAKSSTSDRSNSTIAGEIDPLTLEWTITTTPIRYGNQIVTSHFTINSKVVNPNLLLYLEKILYGTSLTEPRLPDPSELKDIFEMDWNTSSQTVRISRGRGRRSDS